MDFLSSGIPETVRRQAEASAQVETPWFPNVPHVQQRDDDAFPWDLAFPDLNLLPEVHNNFCDPYRGLTEAFYPFKKEDPTSVEPSPSPFIRVESVRESLLKLAERWPQFPVVDLFRSIVSRK